MSRFNGKRGRFSRFSQVLEVIIPTEVPGKVSSGYLENNGSNSSYNNGSVKVYFTPRPSSEGVTSYTIYDYHPLVQSIVATGTSSPITVNNVYPVGTDHEYGITATNVVGTSESYNLGYVQVTTIPNKPTVSVTSGNSSLTLTVSGEDGESSISYWDVYANNFAGPHITRSYDNIIDISNLTNGTEYTFVVVATNSNGQSIPSDQAIGTPAAAPSGTTFNLDPAYNTGIVSEDSLYRYRTFTSSGFLEVLSGPAINVDLLMVAGGGGSGFKGGGGAGGVLNQNSVPLEYHANIGVGAGGASGSNGSNTYVSLGGPAAFGYTAIGGGTAGAVGGSGGGTTGGGGAEGTPGQGYAGAGGQWGGGSYAGGGGGGAGGPGSYGSYGGGNGGQGTGAYASWGTLASNGYNGYFAGGGAGGGYPNGPGTGVHGGGQGGYDWCCNTNGAAYTGGGGGGGQAYGTSGGSGFVIVRYLKSDATN